MKEITIDWVTYVPKSEQVTNTEWLTYCIVRTYSAWVWAWYIDFSSHELWRYVYNARRLWRWDSKFTLSELAETWIRKEDSCKFAIPVKVVWLTQIIEVIPCTDIAKNMIESVEDYTP